MTYVPYVSFIDHRLRRVGCMKCNKFLYDMGDRVSLEDAKRMNLPNRAFVEMSDGSALAIIMCNDCGLTDLDLPLVELSMKWAWLKEFIQAGRPRENILELAKRIKTLKILKRRAQ